MDSIYSIQFNGINLFNDEYLLDKWSKKILKLPNNLYRDTNTLIINFSFFPIRNLQKFNHYSLKQLMIDSAHNKTIFIPSKDLNKSIVNNIFSNSLYKSGTIFRGFSFGTGKDISINSGLRLQLAGKLNDDIEIVAALTDENSPILPEGNTRNIQELDKVFIQAKHKNAELTFGDFNFSNKMNTFNDLERKLKGLNARAIFDQNRFEILYASQNGKYQKTSLVQVEGMQGPYKLIGKNGERDIIILAGTEKVYLNGERLDRGENFDYTVDYSTSELYFTNKNLITSNSRIIVEYEYNDRKYDRSFWGASSYLQLFDKKLDITMSYFLESDNKSKPIDSDLSESDIKLLEEAGTDYYKASKSGVSFAGVDSMGLPIGRYKKVYLSGEKYYFEFAPGNDSSLYNVSFSFVGNNNGNYLRDGITKFRYIGEKKGNYDTLIILPLPVSSQVLDMNIKTYPIYGLTTQINVSLSRQDKNMFSDESNSKFSGLAYNVNINYDSINTGFSGLALGYFGLSFRQRELSSNYFSFSNINEIEFERNWNINTITRDNAELLREIGLSHFYQEYLRLDVNYGLFKKGNELQTKKYTGNITSKISPLSSIVGADFSYLTTNNSAFLSEWYKQQLRYQYDLKPLSVKLSLDYEIKKDSYENSDSLLGISNKYFNSSILVYWASGNNFDLSSEYQFRRDYLPEINSFFELSNSSIYSLNVNLNRFYGFNNYLQISYRNKSFTEKYKASGLLDNNSMAIKWINKGDLFGGLMLTDLLYDASSLYSAKLEKIFIRVAKATGNYSYIGDRNKNGLVDESDFDYDQFYGDYILTTYPTETLFPVTDLKLSFRTIINFNRINFKLEVLDFIKLLSTESYYRIEENSKDVNSENVYLVKLSSFLNPNSTLRGSQLFQQDLYILKNNQEFNIRFRFQDKKGFSQFSTNNETRFQNEKSMKLNWKMLEQIGLQVDYLTSRNLLSTDKKSFREFNLEFTQYSGKFIYFPMKAIEVNFIMEYMTGKDKAPQINTIVRSNSQSINLNYAINEISKMSFYFQRSEFNISESSNYLPYELVGNNLNGINWNVRSNIDYKINNHIQSNFYYDARIRPNEKIIHNARTEIRAYF